MSLTGRLKDIISAEKSGHHLGQRKAKVISIISQKGGVGKTTTSVNLGSILNNYHNKKVLVCDFDPQGHVEKSLGNLVPDGVEYTPLSKILTQKNGNILDCIVTTDMEDFHLTPGDRNLAETEGILASKIGKEFIFQTALAVAKTHYDYILIDCPPSLGNLTLNALVASDYVLIPCEMSVLAFEGVSDLLDTLDVVNDRLNKKLKVLGLLFTRVDGRNISMNDLITKNMKKYFNGKIFKTMITVNTDLNKAQLEGIPIFRFAPSCSGSKNYRSLAEEVLKRTRTKTAAAN
jgi:chromosome partitioning protein